MIHDRTIEGILVSLKPVMSEDAEFILKLRQRDDVSRYMHRVDISVEQQIQWIKTHQEIDGDYYFLIWSKDNRRIGTISLYNKFNDHCEVGRLASIGNPIENIEAIILTYNFAFGELGYKYLVGSVAPDNKNVKNLNKRLGVVFNDEIVSINGMLLQFGKVKKEDYFTRRPNIIRFLRETL